MVTDRGVYSQYLASGCCLVKDLEISKTKIISRKMADGHSQAWGDSVTCGKPPSPLGFVLASLASNN